MYYGPELGQEEGRREEGEKRAPGGNIGMMVGVMRDEEKGGLLEDPWRNLGAGSGRVDEEEGGGGLTWATSSKEGAKDLIRSPSKNLEAVLSSWVALYFLPLEKKMSLNSLPFSILAPLTLTVVRPTSSLPFQPLPSLLPFSSLSQFISPSFYLLDAGREKSTDINDVSGRITTSSLPPSFLLHPRRTSTLLPSISLVVLLYQW
jgi:hypothetical protein